MSCDNITVSPQNQVNVTVSSAVTSSSTDVSSFATIVNLEATGQTLYGYINDVSGLLGSNVTVTGISVTGSASLTGLVNISGENISFTISDNTIIFSGTSDTSGIIASINALSGISITGNGTNYYVPKFTPDGKGLINSNITSSGAVTTISNTLNIGTFSFNSNPGEVTLIDLPITSGISNSGVEQSYGFNIGGFTAAKIYAESDNISGIQNQSFHINSALVLKPSGINSNFVLGTNPFYYYNGSNMATGTMPLISQSTGRLYLIKNLGNSLTLTGQGTDLFYNSYLIEKYTLNSGNSCVVINDSNYWNIIIPQTNLATSVNIASGAENGSVLGLNLASIPKNIGLTVQSPSGYYLLFAGLVNEATTDGFYYQLNAPTDTTGYKLHYNIFL